MPQALLVATDISSTYNPAVSHFGESIRRFRKERGLTQKELGDLAGGMALDTVNRAEAGDNLKIETVSRLAAALGVPIGRLFTDPTRDEQQRPPWWDSPEVAVLLELWRQLEREDRELVVDTMHRMARLTRRAGITHVAERREEGYGAAPDETAVGPGAPPTPSTDAGASSTARRRRQRRSKR